MKQRELSSIQSLDWVSCLQEGEDWWRHTYDSSTGTCQEPSFFDNRNKEVGLFLLKNFYGNYKGFLGLLGMDMGDGFWFLVIFIGDVGVLEIFNFTVIFWMRL